MKAMKPTKLFTALFSLVLVSLALGTSLKADEWNKKTYVTINAPVEIPGRVLEPGTYVFKLMDNAGDRHIVQILNKDENQVIATLLAIPDYRPQPADKTIITFGENVSGAPPAVKEWFYPGEDIGQEFVYNRTRAMQIAKNSNENVLSTTDKSTQPKGMMKADVNAVTPQGQNAEISSTAHAKQ